MIVAYASDPLLRSALARAARPDEDVVWSAPAVEEARTMGFPRLIVRVPEDDPGGPRGSSPSAESVPELTLTKGMLQAWEAERRAAPVPEPRVAVAARRLRVLIRDRATGPTWVDRTIGDLSRAVGAPLPPAFVGMGRRVLEFPSYYSDLHALAEVTGLSRGALKARFRRRDLESPSTWIRWFRVLAAAHLLADRSLTTLDVALRLGMTGSGNLCRLVQDVAGVTTTRARDPGGRERLLLTAAAHLTSPERRERWETLEDVFLRGVA